MNEAIRQVTHVQNIRYDKATERLYIIAQTLLPNEEKEIELRTVEEMLAAVKMLRIRGAPAIGICAGYCMYALARDIDAKDNETFYRKLQIDGELLGAARPTAVKLRWAVGEMLDAAKAQLDAGETELAKQKEALPDTMQNGADQLVDGEEQVLEFEEQLQQIQLLVNLKKVADPLLGYAETALHNAQKALDEAEPADEEYTGVSPGRSVQLAPPSSV